MATAITEGHVLHWARLYDWGTRLFGHSVRKLHQRAIERANVSAGVRVLDVGCGPGRLALAAARRAGPTGETLGIDPSREMVALATRNAARASSSAQFRVATIEAVPAANDHFDVVLATLMLHHLSPDLQRRGLAEIRRVLKPGGRFVAADFGATPGHGLGHLLSVLGVRRGSEYAQYLGSIIAGVGFEKIEIEPTQSGRFCVILARKP